MLQKKRRRLSETSEAVIEKIVKKQMKHICSGLSIVCKWVAKLMCCVFMVVIDSELGPGYRSAIQESALVTSLQMFSLVLERTVQLLRDQLNIAYRLIVSDDMLILLPAIKVRSTLVLTTLSFRPLSSRQSCSIHLFDKLNVNCWPQMFYRKLQFWCNFKYKYNQLYEGM